MLERRDSRDSLSRFCTEHSAGSNVEHRAERTQAGPRALEAGELLVAARCLDSALARLVRHMLASIACADYSSVALQVESQDWMKASQVDSATASSIVLQHTRSPVVKRSVLDAAQHRKV